MSDPDFSLRLVELETLLGQTIDFVEPLPEPEPLQANTAQTTENTQSTELAREVAKAREWDIQRQRAREIEEQAREKAAMAERHRKAFDCSTFRPGEPVDQATTFCPWKVVKNYPEAYIGKANRPRAKPFFDDILSERTWDFFYLHEPQNAQKNPHLLVPTSQFQAFLDKINGILETSLTIPPGANEEKFFMQFGQGGTPRPRYLKRSTTENGLDIHEWPSANLDDISSFSKASVQLRADWNAQLKVIQRGISYSSKASSVKASRKKQEREQMLRAMQQYLGLQAGSTMPDIVFICVDVEAIELPPNPISEIGIAILDTANLKGTPLDATTSAKWLEEIQTYHLRVKEYSGLRNHRFVQGCPDYFDYGTSTFPSIAEVPGEINSIFNTYINQSRRVVLVGHDVAQDIKYLSSYGIYLLQIENVIGQVDSKDIYQAWRDEQNGRGLHHVLSQLKVPYRNLHNAGNDAYFTLYAAVLVALEAYREEEQKRQEKPEGWW